MFHQVSIELRQAFVKKTGPWLSVSVMDYVEYLLAAFTVNALDASLARQIYTISSGFQLSKS
jgi:hypothetical protein